MMTKYRRFICKCDNDWMTVLPDIDTCQVCYDDQALQDIANWIKNIDQSADTTSPGAKKKLTCSDRATSSQAVPQTRLRRRAA